MEQRTYIERVMFERRISATEVARIVGIKRQSVQNWKTRGVPDAHFKVVAKALGISVLDLEREYGTSGMLEKIASLDPHDRARVNALINELAAQE